MQPRWLLVVAALAAATLACNINLNVPRMEIGPTETVTVAVPAPDSGTAAVTLNMGAGELALSGGAAGLVQGEIAYNVAALAPEVDTRPDGVTIEQGDPGELGLPESAEDVVNEWDLQLGDVPMELAINAGAYEGDLDLGGVPLRRLAVRDGASDVELSFAEPNPESMDELSYETGASSVTLTGLANANFERLNFTGGAGDYELNFSGELQRDGHVEINAGLGSLRIVVPEGMAARVTVTGALADVDSDGGWTQTGDTYATSGSGPVLTIDIDMGAGSLDLVMEPAS